eukprot:786670-Rhodomonas_salina.2
MVDPRPWISDPRPWTLDPTLWPGPWTLFPGPGSLLPVYSGTQLRHQVNYQASAHRTVLRYLIDMPALDVAKRVERRDLVHLCPLVPTYTPSQYQTYVPSQHKVLVPTCTHCPIAHIDSANNRASLQTRAQTGIYHMRGPRRQAGSYLVSSKQIPALHARWRQPQPVFVHVQVTWQKQQQKP